jgi:ABC-type sugar transport system ATPase subunit
MEMDLEYQEDNNFRGFVEDDEQFSNLSIVSKKEKNIRTEGARERVDVTWRIDPAFQNNCTYLNMRLKQLQASIKSELDKNPSQTTVERFINPMRDYEAQYKRLLERNNCSDLQSKREQLEAEKRTEEAIRRAASDIPDFALTDVEDKGSNINKYLIFGVGGLILVVTAAILLKK